MTPIMGKVAAVLSADTFVINRGSQDGVKVGQKYAVIELGPTIIDPELGVPLADLEIPKGRLRIRHVQPQISTAVSDETIEVPIFSWPTFETTRKAPRQLAAEVNLPINAPGPIRVGDLVRQLD